MALLDGTADIFERGGKKTADVDENTVRAGRASSPRILYLGRLPHARHHPSPHILILDRTTKGDVMQT